MSDSFRVIAIISAFNEADIISPVIGHLVENGIDVYLMDNHSTDDTIQQAERWLGKGLLDIEQFPQSSADTGKFDWTAILRRKEELASTLEADWFIHHDADEIRESPWPGLCVKEAIRWVDALGYNCINFRVLNFPPIDDEFKKGNDPRTYFIYYEEAQDFDKLQLKCWKAGIAPISLVQFGGHEVFFEGRRVFPTPFLLRHYPIRSQQHGKRKIFAERRDRFVENERMIGWHRQYDLVTSDNHCFLRDPLTLRRFNLDRARLELLLPETLRSDFEAVTNHSAVLEQGLKEARDHAANLEEEVRQLKAHSLSLQQDRDAFKSNARNLESDRAELRRHATNLELDRDEVKRHAANLQREWEALKVHTAKVEKDRDEVKLHAADLEKDRGEVTRQVTTLREELSDASSRADSLRQLVQRLEERKGSLERELAQIQNSFIWRSTSALRRFFGIGDKIGKTRFPSNLDIPAEAQIAVAETCRVAGWACAPNGIDSVKIFVDGKEVEQFSPALERPDVALVHPEVRGSDRSGFDVVVQLGVLSRGTHEMAVVVRDGAGNERRHLRSLRVDANPYHRVLLEKQLRGRDRDALQQSIAATGRSPRFELWVDARSGEAVADTLRSIAAQTYPNWTCHIVESAAGVMSSCIERSLPGGVQCHTSFASAIASDAGLGDYLAFLRAGERLMPDALLHFASRLADEPASLAYSDHDLVQPTGTHTDPDYVPDWSPEHLYGRNYVGGVFFARRDEIRKHGLAADGAAWRYDLLLRVSESAQRITHVSRVLWTSSPFDPPGAASSDELRAVEAALKRRGIDAEVLTLPDVPVRRIRRRLNAAPKVSIIIPTTGRPSLVRPLVESLAANTSYPNYELVFLDNGHGKHSYGIEFLRSRGLQVVERDEPFNWARLNNAGACSCDGEILLFLNDDIEVIEPGWLEELVTQVLVPDVGTVGALLFYPDGRIQHAGVFLVDHGGGCRHYLQFLDPKLGTYQHLDRVAREVTASTGACLMIRREVFEEAGGFDEEFGVAFNDVDLCVRLLERGYRNLWTPHCRLVHHESLSRKGTNITADEQRAWSQWGRRLLAGDAYHNPNLAKDRADCAIDTSVLNRKPAAAEEPGEGPGINLIGYICAENGVGEAARGLARAIERTRIPFVIIDYEHRNPSRKEDLAWCHRIVERPVHDINILHVNADLTPEACERLGAKLFKGRYTIGYWVWELPEFPDRWLSSFDYVNEVWVPTEFVRAAIARKSKVPVTRIPHPVEKGPGPYYERPFFDLPGASFLFLSMYDTYSIVERKNPAAVIAAFRDAFPPTDRNVGLVVKINNFGDREGEKLRALAGDHKNIYLIDRTLTRYEVDSLLACCDCFVSLHRSEGFGLPIAEAMALGKPVIATYWSGNVDFMDQSCAASVDYKICELGRAHGPYDAHQRWAEPSLESAARWMRTLQAEPATARRIGSAGRKRIRDEFSDRAVGELICARLAQIAAARG